MMANDNYFLSRRRWLEIVAAAVVPPGTHGFVRPPVAVPDLIVQRADGLRMKLAEVLQGRGTALQLMFTQCETTCPMQGAIFEQVQKSVPDLAARRLQLVSLSIDPAGDTTTAMSRWLRRFHAGSNWIGLTPSASDVRTIQEFFGGGSLRTDDHSTQVQLLNRKAELVWRTSELPSAQEVASLLAKL